MEQTIETNEKPTQQKNLIVAILLSIFAGIPGCLVLGLLLNFGFVASVSGLIISSLMYYTFQKFYKTESKWLYVYIVVLSLIEIFVATLIADGLIVQQAYKAETIVISFGQAINIMFTESKLLGAFFSDFAMCALFSVIGIVSTIVGIKRKKQFEQFQQSTKEQTQSDATFEPAQVVDETENKDKENDQKQLESSTETPKGEE